MDIFNMDSLIMIGNRSTRHRRNGKLEACEPCRKHKIRCDHGLPRCGRCTKKEIKCTYHPAPLTKTQPSASSSLDDGLETSVSASDSGMGPIPMQTSPHDVPTHLVVGQDALALPASTPNTDQLSPGARITRSEFLGPTSFAEGFKREPQSADDGWMEPLIIYEPVQPRPALALLSRERISAGSRILPMIKLLPALRTLTARYCDVSPMLNSPRIVIEKFMDDLEALIPVVSTEKGAMEVSALLFRNSGLHVDITADMTPASFASEYIGPKLRWETIAYTFGMAGMACYLDEECENGKGRLTQVRSQLAYGTNALVDFADSVESLTDVAMWAGLQNLVFVTFIYGDVAHLGWRQLNMLSCSIFAKGLHRDPPDETKIPFWLAQLRRRVFAGSFSMDKSLATFFGRPPRISQIYCSKVLALDLSEDELYAERDVRNAAIASLDSNGWNTTGSYHLSTWTRFKYIIGMVRESALKLSLAEDLEDLERTARNALASIERHWATIPNFLKYSDSIWDSDISSNTCFNLLYYHLRFQYSRFLIHRVLVRHFNDSAQELFQIAQSILTGTLAISTYRDRRGVLAIDFAWVALFYGLPAATLLSMELLKQKESPTRICVKLPRAAILRQVSVFTSALEWIAKPGNGNLDLVLGSKRMLDKVLDAILNDDEPSGPMTGSDIGFNSQDPVTWINDAFGEGWMAQGALAETNADNTSWLNSLDFANWPDQPYWQQQMGLGLGM